MTTAEYLLSPAISNSKLNWLKRSPLHFKHYMDSGAETTATQEFGWAFHTAVLNARDFLNNYYMLPATDGRTITGKLANKLKAAENKGKTGVNKTNFELILNMQKAVHSSRQAAKLLTGSCQTAIFWTDKDSLTSCKALVDIWQKGEWMADVVTTKCADPDFFTGEIIKYSYHRKAAFSLDGAGENIPYYIIACEKEAPYAVSVIRLSDELLEKGRQEYKSLLSQFNLCLENDCWPGYEIRSLCIPSQPSVYLKSA